MEETPRKRTGRIDARRKVDEKTVEQMDSEALVARNWIVYSSRYSTERAVAAARTSMWMAYAFCDKPRSEAWMLARFGSKCEVQPLFAIDERDAFASLERSQARREERKLTVAPYEADGEQAAGAAGGHRRRRMRPAPITEEDKAYNSRTWHILSPTYDRDDAYEGVGSGWEMYVFFSRHQSRAWMKRAFPRCALSVKMPNDIKHAEKRLKKMRQ